MMRRFFSSTLNRVMLILNLVLLVLLAAIRVLDAAGLALVHAWLPALLSVVLVTELLGWGAFLLVTRIRNRPVQVAMATACCFLVLLAGLALIFFALPGMMSLPHRYASITSSDGRRAVILEQPDAGQGGEEEAEAARARMDIRRDAFAAAGGTWEEDQEYPDAAFGYRYTAAPEVMGIFYRKNAEGEGAVYKGYASAARLMYTWNEDKTLELWLADAEPGDEGTFLLHG